MTRQTYLSSSGSGIFLGIYLATSTKDEIKGNFNEVKGKVKETAGRITNDPDLQADGIAEYNAGKVGKKVGRVKKVFESR